MLFEKAIKNIETAEKLSSIFVKPSGDAGENSIKVIDISTPDEELVDRKHIKQRFWISLEDPCVEYKLQQLFNINCKTWADYKLADLLPKEGTNRQFLVALFNIFKNKKNSPLASNREAKLIAREESEEYVELLKQEKIGIIKLNRAKEQSVYIANLEKRRLLIDRREEAAVIEILVRSIMTVLRGAAEEDPKLQPAVDRCFISLYKLGELYCKQVTEDEESYVADMLRRPLDLHELPESLALLDGEGSAAVMDSSVVTYKD